jgi:photosystem II stability/assembly factor-like uncharacterized protein
MRRLLFSVILLAVLLTVGCLASVPGGPTTVPDTPTASIVTSLPPPVSAPVVENPQLISFHMLSELDGWGITESAVLRTNDGGTTWHDVTPPGATFLGYGASGSYLDGRDAFIAAADPADPMHAGMLYRTQDGGQSWVSNPIPFGNGQLYFFDDMQQGWAMASLGVAAGSNAIAIFQTTDEGQTWEQTFVNDPTVQGSAAGIPLGGLKGVFFPLSMQTAWVGGIVYSDRTSYLYRTDDGGHHWKQVELASPNPDEAQWSVESIQFVTAEDGFLTMQVTGQTVRRALYVTHDAGDTWVLTPTLIPNGMAADFVSASDGFIFDGQQFQVTHDAGQSWTQVEPDVVFSESFMSMDFVNAQMGWVTASDPTTFKIGVYKTTDGGKTWIPQ